MWDNDEEVDSNTGEALPSSPEPAQDGELSDQDPVLVDEEMGHQGRNDPSSLREDVCRDHFSTSGIRRAADLSCGDEPARETGVATATIDALGNVTLLLTHRESFRAAQLTPKVSPGSNLAVEDLLPLPIEDPPEQVAKLLMKVQPPRPPHACTPASTCCPLACHAARTHSYTLYPLLTPSSHPTPPLKG